MALSQRCVSASNARSRQPGSRAGPTHAKLAGKRRGLPSPQTGERRMIEHRWVALVSLLALLAYFWMSTQVPRARIKCGISAPAMMGDPLLERTIRVHYNTLEW